MCSIVGSYDFNKLYELIKLNQYRGSFSYSFSVLNIETGEIESTIKEFGKFNIDIYHEVYNKYHYYIAHVQAPTGGLIKDTNRIHPSVKKDSYLWHNGILKEDYIKEVQNRYNLQDGQWDTGLLHNVILDDSFGALNNVDGSFGCLFNINSKTYLFTSDIIQLFVDDELNISSVKFEGSVKIKPNMVYEIDFNNFNIEELLAFRSKSSPYFIP